METGIKTEKELKAEERFKKRIEEFRKKPVYDWLITFLVEMDKRFYAKSASYAVAKKQFARDWSQEKIPHKIFVYYVYMLCDYWKNPDLPKHRRASEGLVSLSAKQWEKVQAAVARQKQVINEPDADVAFCVKFLSAESGVALNETLLMNCSAFHKATDGKFRKVANS